jgi:hypothetical protein
MKASSVHPRGYHASGYGPHSQDIHHAVQGSYLALCGVKDPARYTLDKMAVSCPLCRVNLFMTALEPSEERLRRALWRKNPDVGIKPKAKVKTDAEDPRNYPATAGGVPQDVARQLRRTMYRKDKPVRVHKAGASVTVARPEAGQ